MEQVLLPRFQKKLVSMLTQLQGQNWRWNLGSVTL